MREKEMDRKIGWLTFEKEEKTNGFKEVNQALSSADNLCINFIIVYSNGKNQPFINQLFLPFSFPEKDFLLSPSFFLSLF